MFNNLLYLYAPYSDYGSFRIKKSTNGNLILVSQKHFNLIVTDLNLNTRISFTNIKDCYTELKINRKNIVNCLIYKTSYKGYTFNIESI